LFLQFALIVNGYRPGDTLKTSRDISLSISNDKLQVVWEDDSTGNHEISYKSINLT